MKTKILLHHFKRAPAFLILFSAFTLTMDIGAQPQYYNTNTGTGTNTFPFGQTNQRVHWLIRPGTLNVPSQCPPGNITTLFFYMGNTSTGTFTNLTIKLGQTAATTLPPAWYTGAALATVYFRPSVTLSSTNSQWMSIILDTPFPFDTSQSLIIDVENCATTGFLHVRQSSGTPATRNYGNPNTGCPINYIGQDGQIINFGVNIAAAGTCAYVWGSQTSGTITLLYSVKAVSNLVGWAAGSAATVRRTTDGGLTWTNGNPNPGVINGDVYAIEAIDANTAWCTTSPTATFIYRTTNGGVNWTQVFIQIGGFIDDIKFNNANTGFAMGDPVLGRWSLWKTSNGGVTWDSAGLYLVQAGGEAGWNNCMSVIGNHIWFGTSNTRVYRSTNYGSSWSFSATTGLVNSFSLHFNLNTVGLVGGTTILRTTDGGATYSSIGTPPGAGNISGIEGIGTDFWYVRGTGIYRSTNNGTNWTLSHTGTSAFSDIDFAIVNGCPEGWAVGAGGQIRKMANLVGIGNNNNEIPNAYRLEQNYPNPFNPTTKISFALPKAGHVELKVYDVLGREAATLVNDYKQAGSYTIEFNADALASGVYFYSIKSGDFTDTKKMMMIK